MTLLMSSVLHFCAEIRCKSIIKVSRIFALETFPYSTFYIPVLHLRFSSFHECCPGFHLYLSPLWSIDFQVHKRLFLVCHFLHYSFSLSCSSFAAPHLLSEWVQWLRHCFLIQVRGPGDWGMQSIWRFCGTSYLFVVLLLHIYSEARECGEGNLWEQPLGAVATHSQGHSPHWLR